MLMEIKMRSAIDFFEPRLVNLAKIPGDVVPELAKDMAKGISGIGFSVLSIVTFGNIKAINDNAGETYRMHRILPFLFSSTIQVLNPKYIFSPDNVESKISIAIADPILNKAYELAKEEDFLSRHVVSRGLFAIGTPVAVIAQLADFALGLVGATASLLTLMISLVTNYRRLL